MEIKLSDWIKKKLLHHANIPQTLDEKTSLNQRIRQVLHDYIVGKLFYMPKLKDPDNQALWDSIKSTKIISDRKAIQTYLYLKDKEIKQLKEIIRELNEKQNH
jgi:hypothetical protein